MSPPPGQWARSFEQFGFIRDAAGKITRFSIPVANAFMLPRGINNADRIVGSYFDSDLVAHGFIR